MTARRAIRPIASVSPGDHQRVRLSRRGYGMCEYRDQQRRRLLPNPRALCGIVGYKPSRQRIPTEGAFPLSYSIDLIGPLARAVEACAKADAVMAGERLCRQILHPLRVFASVYRRVSHLRIWTRPSRSVFPRHSTCSSAPAHVSPTRRDPAQGRSKGGVQPAEAFAVHRDLLSRRADAIDPNVRVRLERARNASAADYIDMVRDRARLILLDGRTAYRSLMREPCDHLDCRTNHGGGYAG